MLMLHMSLTGERGQEKQARGKFDEIGLNKTKQDKCDIRQQAINASLKTDTKPLKSQTEHNCKISSNHISNKQECKRTDLSSPNVSNKLGLLFKTAR